MGRMWNAKKVKCKICGEEFDSVREGKGHIYIHHKKKYSVTRDYLEGIEEGD